MSQFDNTNQESYEELIQSLVAANADAVEECPRREIGLELILRRAAAEAKMQREDVVESVRSALHSALNDPTTWSEIQEMSDAEPPADLIERYLNTESVQAQHRLLLQLTFSGCAKWSIRLLEIKLEQTDADPEQAARLRQLLKQWRDQLGFE